MEVISFHETFDTNKISRDGDLSRLLWRFIASMAICYNDESRFKAGFYTKNSVVLT